MKKFKKEQEVTFLIRVSGIIEEVLSDKEFIINRDGTRYKVLRENICEIN